MPNQGQFRWIVLVNKSPRGPLTEAEVRMLLAQGVVRHNDLAYRVSADDPKEKSDWKLLWQFDEFDRRTPESYNVKKKPPEKEQRDETPPEEVVKQNLEQLPVDLRDIGPEELIPRSRSMSAAEEEAKWGQMQEDAVAAMPKMRFSIAIPRWIYGLGAVVLVSFLFFRWVSTKNFSTSRLTPTMPAPEATNEEHPSPRGTASRPSRPSTPPRTNPLAPSREVVPTERPRDYNDRPSERDLDRDRDRDRDREEEGARQEEAAQTEERPPEDTNYEGSRGTPAPAARRPAFRKKAGGNIDEESVVPPEEGARSDVPLPNEE